MVIPRITYHISNLLNIERPAPLFTYREPGITYYSLEGVYILLVLLSFISSPDYLCPTYGILYFPMLAQGLPYYNKLSVRLTDMLF